MTVLRVISCLLLSLVTAVAAQQPVFDAHVHLHDGEASLEAYEADAAAANIDLIGFGGMWFGGPSMALRGDPKKMRAGKDAQIALAATHTEMLPIASVHPYDGRETG